MSVQVNRGTLFSCVSDHNQVNSLKIILLSQTSELCLYLKPKIWNATKCNFNIIIVNTHAKQIHQTSTICQKSPLNALQLIVLFIFNIRSTSLIRINTQTFPINTVYCAYMNNPIIFVSFYQDVVYTLFELKHTRQGCLNTSEEKQLLNSVFASQ